MQVSLSCVNGQVISGRDCYFCKRDQQIIFSGLKLTYDSGRVLYVRKPFEIKQTGNVAVVSFDQNNTVAIDLADTQYATMPDLITVLKNCQTSGAGGGVTAVTGTYTQGTGNLNIDVDGVNDDVVLSMLSENSVVGDGAATPFALENDQAAPGNNKVYGTDGAGARGWKNDPAGGGGHARDSLASGTVTAEVDRIGGSATTITNPAAGEYNLNVQAGAYFARASVFGNNTVLNGSNEFIIRIDNSSNTEDRRVSIALYDANNGAKVDQQATATVDVQAVAANVTTVTIPGVNGFGAAGFFVEIT